jgi:hypothetical protein
MGFQTRLFRVPNVVRKRDPKASNQPATYVLLFGCAVGLTTQGGYRVGIACVFRSPELPGCWGTVLLQAGPRASSDKETANASAGRCGAVERSIEGKSTALGQSFATILSERGRDPSCSMTALPHVSGAQ